MRRGKFLLALQYHAGDAARATALLDLVVDLTLQANGGKRSEAADLLVNPSFDAPIDMSALRRAGRAFAHVLTFRGRSRVSGWPQGPNVQASEVFQYFVTRQRAGLWNYTGLMLAEPDSVPLRDDFLACIQSEWNATDRLVLGCWIGQFPNGNPDGSQSHINGNLVIDHRFADLHPDFLLRHTPIAWDAFWRFQLVANAKASMTIFSDYRLGSPENPIPDDDHMWRPIRVFNTHPLAGLTWHPAWLHGPKVDGVLEIARARLVRSAAVAP